ncbi:hypothetical protein PAXINDRAFT_20987 [Paxillus involutus ATCC 200175]|uniref:Uncharacterized protein n=1 Tax=Paxillus involutus ATCC 200175 TaxID=664439 RepID=A0A0C9T2P4_PAXIN|nr:hypothetical protein PAXINDRAFT_20987 [Paxillus involutus ATCC 200175]
MAAGTSRGLVVALRSVVRTSDLRVKDVCGRRGCEFPTPGRGATDQTASSVSQAATPSSQDDDGDDVHVHHTHVEPHPLNSTLQTAVEEATDTSNPNATSAGPTEPAGTSHGMLNGIDDGVEGGNSREVVKDVKVEDEKGEWVSGIEDPSSNNDGGDEDICHLYVVPNATQPVPYHTLPTPNE